MMMAPGYLIANHTGSRLHCCFVGDYEDLDVTSSCDQNLSTLSWRTKKSKYRHTRFDLIWILTCGSTCVTLLGNLIFCIWRRSCWCNQQWTPISTACRWLIWVIYILFFFHCDISVLIFISGICTQCHIKKCNLNPLFFILLTNYICIA